MKILKQGAIRVEPASDYVIDIYRHVERCGRISYKSSSEDNSYETFIKRIIKNGHTSVLEHGYIGIRVPGISAFSLKHKYFFRKDDYIIGNFRAWRDFFTKKNVYQYSDMELLVLLELKTMYSLIFGDIDCHPDVSGVIEIIHLKYSEFPQYLSPVTYYVRCDRGISHEQVRHRESSITQKSTRYVNSLDMEVIEPPFFKCDEDRDKWLKLMYDIEQLYGHYIDKGYKPQEARCVLPNCLETELYVTALNFEWQHIFDLRISSGAHPQMRALWEGAK
jgi:thymidylate synthase ThyX